MSTTTVDEETRMRRHRSIRQPGARFHLGWGWVALGIGALAAGALAAGALAAGARLGRAQAQGHEEDERATRERPFAEAGEPSGWSTRRWDDLSRTVKLETAWKVQDGILIAGRPRGSWLVSDAVYGDVEIGFEFRLGPQGNSGLALRCPLQGDPAFEGIEIQLADPRYHPFAAATRRAGAIYAVVPPLESSYRQDEWNRLHVRLEGSNLEVRLNNVLVQKVDLETMTDPVTGHEGRPRPALADRPRQGRVALQELSRGEQPSQFRDFYIRPL